MPEPDWAVRIPLGGKVASVTGGPSGMGRAVALRLAEAGAEVAVLDVRADGERVVEEMGRERARFYKRDVTSSSEASETIKKVYEGFGGMLWSMLLG